MHVLDDRNLSKRELHAHRVVNGVVGAVRDERVIHADVVVVVGARTERREVFGL